MMALTTREIPSGAPQLAGSPHPKPSFVPAFIGDWAEAAFVHFAVPPKALQPQVPIPLHIYNGWAYVSLVAFTMRRFRPAWLDSPFGELCLSPVAPCRFLNVRTYVQHGGQAGIFFLGEWLSNWINIPLGPALYGLPYHAGLIDFQGNARSGSRQVRVRSLSGEELSFRAVLKDREYGPANPSSLDDFLLERYVAFTVRRGELLTFQVDHKPWAQGAAHIELIQTKLLLQSGGWAEEGRLAGGHLSPGVDDVHMGGPRRYPHFQAENAVFGTNLAPGFSSCQ